MTDTTDTLRELIGRLEEATGPSRELDALIHTAVTGKDVIYEGGERPHSAVIVGTETWTNRDGSESATVEGYAPFYTASLDAAIPAESIRKVERRRHSDVAAHWVACQDGNGNGCGYEGHAATEPLARRVAALRALAALKEAQS